MKWKVTLCAVVGAALCIGATAQQPPQGQGQPGQQRHRMALPDKFSNLQVLPKDISKDELIGTMRMFARSLGERCDFCHESEESRSQPDFASDAKPEKKIAREMLRMQNDINLKYLEKIKMPEGDAADRVNCWTCHRSHKQPETGPPAPPDREHQGTPPAPPATNMPRPNGTSGS